MMCVVAVLIATTALAQDESRFRSDLRREGGDIRDGCGGGFNAKNVAGCVVVLATDDPLHVSIGSLAPQNGIGAGLAFSEHSTPNNNWRIGWNADGVATPSGAWRTGVYIKFIHIPTSPGIGVIRPGTPGGAPGRPPTVTVTEYPVLNTYAQVISLDKLTVEAGHNPFSEKQTIVGANVIFPIAFAPTRPLRIAFVGSANGRFVHVRSDTLALDERRSFAQFEEGLRLKPSAFGGHLRLNYLVGFEQFATSAESAASFHRWTLDLKHDIPLYRTISSAGPKDSNGPDECFEAIGSRCPPISYSRNLEGSVGFRLLTTRATAADGNRIPFYFQPTLGGSDINGERLLSAFDDYRFRGPNLIALQESVEHSIWGPFGIYLLAEQGKVTQDGEGFGSGDLEHSFGVGLTIRAGGFPLINFTFAWGNEGHHMISTIDPSLLGGSGRPSLY